MQRKSKSKGPPSQEKVLHYHELTLLEQKIIDKIDELKKKFKKLEVCQHLLKSEEPEKYESKVDYYEEFWKLVMKNYVWISQIDNMKEELADINKAMDSIEVVMV